MERKGKGKKQVKTHDFTVENSTHVSGTLGNLTNVINEDDEMVVDKRDLVSGKGEEKENNAYILLCDSDNTGDDLTVMKVSIPGPSAEPAEEGRRMEKGKVSQELSIALSYLY